MQIRMIGLGVMGSGMVGRLAMVHHESVVSDSKEWTMAQFQASGLSAATSFQDMVLQLTSPRVICLMVPVVVVVDSVLASVHSGSACDSTFNEAHVGGK